MPSSDLNSWEPPHSYLIKLFFPEASPSMKTSFLKPHNSSPAKLADWRLFNMVFNLILILERGFRTSNANALNRFTYWSMHANFFAYCTLTIGHVLNNDFGKRNYIAVDPETIDFKKPPYYLWAIAIGTYEFAATAALTVTILWSFIEYPFSRGLDMMVLFPWYFDVLGWLIHTLPQVFILLEWRYSSIPFGWRRFPLYFFIPLLYTIVNLQYGEHHR